MSETNYEYCKPCMYSTTMSNHPVACTYILATGVSRGCSAGIGCDKRIVGERVSSIDSLIGGSEYSRQKKELAKRTQEFYQGKQRAVIESFLTEKGITSSELGKMIGVARRTVRNWVSEKNQADWSKLEKLGIQKPKIE